MSRSHPWIGKWTRQKEQDFAGLVGGIHVSACAGIRRKYGRPMDPPYVFIDLHAGPGWLRDDAGHTFEGSPLIAARSLAEAAIPHETWHFERDRVVAAEVATALDAAIYPHSRVYNLDFETGIKEWLRSNSSHRYRNGLVYADPIGLDGTTGPIPVDVFNAIAAHSPRVDLLAYVQANNHYKRAGLGRRLVDDISAVNKERVLIRRPDGAEQYTFVFFSDWPDLPKWAKAGFYDLQSAEGQKILRDLNYTKAEIHAQANAPLPIAQRSSARGRGLEGGACPERASLDQAAPPSSRPTQQMCILCGRVTSRRDTDGMPWCGGATLAVVAT